MKSYFAMIAYGLDAVRIAFSKSKIKETAAAVVVGVVGIGLLASPFLVQADETDKAPVVTCIWVENHGSSGFTVEFKVSDPSQSSDSFRLCQNVFLLTLIDNLLPVLLLSQGM